MLALARSRKVAFAALVHNSIEVLRRHDGVLRQIALRRAYFAEDKTRAMTRTRTKTKQCEAVDKTRQDKTRQDKTRQDKTRQDKTRQDKTTQDNKR